jgi:hypothetical protein
MLTKPLIAEITFRHKQTAEDLKFRFNVVDEKHAMKIAKKIRPRYCKLLKVVLISESQLEAEDNGHVD